MVLLYSLIGGVVCSRITPFREENNQNAVEWRKRNGTRRQIDSKRN